MLNYPVENTFGKTKFYFNNQMSKKYVPHKTQHTYVYYLFGSKLTKNTHTSSGGGTNTAKLFDAWLMILDHCMKGLPLQKAMKFSSPKHISILIF